MITYLLNKIDELRVANSLKNRLGKEYRINPYVTIEAALEEVWADLDLALFGSDEKHASQRIKVTESAIKGLRLHERLKQKVCDYLPQKYLNNKLAFSFL